MNNQSYEITVDTQKSINHSNIEFSQNNLNISELIFNITEDGKELPLKDTDEIIVYFKKPDKTVVFQDKEIELLDKSKGKVKVLLTTQTLVKAGDVEGEISIGRVDNGMKKRTSTYGFSFKVRSSLASNDSIESTNEFQMFDQLLELGKQDIPAIIDSKETAEQALKKSEENANQIGILSQNVTDIMNHPTIVVQNQDPTAPKLGEIWISKGVNIIANGDFETATGSEWALSHGAANTANHVFAHERVTTQKVKGLYSLHISSNDPNYATSSANWNFSKAKQTVNKNLDRLLNFSCRVLVPSVEKYPAGTNAVRINLIVTAYGASGTLTSRKYQLYKSGGTSGDDIDLTSAVLMDNWSKVNINIIRDVIEKGVAWTDVKSVDLTFEAANNIGFYLDDISTF